MSAAIAVRVSPKGAAMPAFSGVPSGVDVWDGRTEKAQKYWDKDFERPWQQSSRRILNDCEPREPLRLVS